MTVGINFSVAQCDVSRNENIELEVTMALVMPMHAEWSYYGTYSTACNKCDDSTTMRVNFIDIYIITLVTYMS